MAYPRATCPRCRRSVHVKDGRYAIHSVTPATGVQCRMSRHLIPAEGTSYEAYEARASIVADLAWQLQDGDPLLAWEYLNALPPERRVDELQRLLMVSLACVPINKGRPNRIWAWVCRLPSALREAA